MENKSEWPCTNRKQQDERTGYLSQMRNTFCSKGKEMSVLRRNQ